MAAGVRYDSLSISFTVLCKTATWNVQILRCLANVNHDDWFYWNFYFKIIAVFRIAFWDSFDSDTHSKWFYSISSFVGKI